MKKLSKSLPSGNDQPISPPSKTPTREESRFFPIVGIGASAGGLEALEQFLRHVPEKCGMAFVIIQHLDPTHKGLMAELLQRTTGMKVLQVTDRMRVKPDSVYVIPPNKEMSILHGALHLFTPTAPRGLRLPIDLFLRSLAEDRREASIGVILSGMGSDGTLGLRAIKEKGGGGAGAGTGLGQVRQYAPERHRCRAGRHRRPGGSAAGEDQRLSAPHPRHQQERESPGGEGSERPGKSADSAPLQNRSRLLALQEEHRLPPH